MTVRTSRILPTVILLAVFIAGDRWLVQGRVGHWLADRTGPVLEPAVAAIGRAQIWGAALLQQTDLVAENLRLQDEIERFRAAAAEADALRHELAFTRAAAGIRERLPTDPIPAGIFSWHRVGTASLATINRGETDGIAVSDVVMTANGSLVGVVREVYARHAVVTVLGDPTLQIAARVMGNEVTGLVRVGEDGLMLDLVQKDESVTEDDIVVTGGNDHFPAGLVIGTVRSVDTSRSTLFSIIRIEPAIPSLLADSVLIVRP